MPYRVEYAKSARSGCTGPKPCSGTKIEKGELRLGSFVDISGHGSFKWRHWRCTTQKVLEKIKEELGEDASNLDGYEDLNDADKAKISKAYELGHVAEEDLANPDEVDTVKGEEEKPESKKKKPKATKKKDDAAEKEEKEEKEEKKAKAPPKKRATKKEADEKNADEDKPKKRGRKPKASAENGNGESEAPAKRKKTTKAAEKKDDE